MGKPKKNTTPKRKESETYYEVDKIVAKSIANDGKCTYRIRWKGYTQKQDTWEPIQHLNKAQKLISQFQLRENQLKKKQEVNKKIKPPTSQNLFTQNCQQKQQRKIQPPKQSDGAEIIKKTKIIEKKQNIIQSQPTKFYKVQKIVDKKFNASKKIEYYRVRWIGYSSQQDTWEPVENLQNVKSLVEQFNQSLQKTKPITKKKNRIHKRFYEIQKIVDKRLINQQQQYRIRWKGCTQAQDTWEPKRNLSKIPNAVKQFDKNFIFPPTQSPQKGPFIIQKTSLREQVGSLLKQSDNYDIGGISLQSEVLYSQYKSQNWIVQQQNDGDDFIPLELPEKQLIQPYFI